MPMEKTILPLTLIGLSIGKLDCALSMKLAFFEAPFVLELANSTVDAFSLLHPFSKVTLVL